MKYLYRFEAVHYSGGVDEWGDAVGGGPIRLHLRQYRILKETPCGAWIDVGYGYFGGVHGSKRFVNLKARKRFACPTEKEAKESFVARKKRQISILQYQLDSAKTELKLATGIVDFEFHGDLVELLP